MSKTASEWDLITNSASVVATISPTIGVFVQTTGVVQLACDTGTMVNFGTVTAGTRLDLEVHQVGTLNTAVLIALR